MITTALGPEDYGVWVLAYVYATAVSSLGNLGLTAAFERNFFECQGEAELGQLYWSLFLFVSSVLSALLLVTWLWRAPLAAFFIGDEHGGTVLFWTTMAVVVASFKMYGLIHLRNQGRARLFAMYSMAEQVLAASLLMVLLLAYPANPLALALAPLLAAALVAIMLSIRLSVELPISLRAEPVVAALRLSLPLLPRTTLGVLGTQFDKWAIGTLVGSGEAAVYAVGQRLANSVFLFMNALQHSFAPKFYREMFSEHESAPDRIGKSFTGYAFATTVVASGLGVFAAEILTLLTDAAYAGAAMISIMLTIHYSAMLFGKMPQLVYRKRTDLVSIIGIGSLLANVVAVWIGASTFGMYGAAMATLIVGLASNAVFTLVSQRHYAIAYEVRTLAVIYGGALSVIIGANIVQQLVAGAFFGLLIKSAMWGLWLVMASASLGCSLRQLQEMLLGDRATE